ncbi:MAG: GNAT family N-acetyltransferase [Candidatus Hodarchaeota archaeon]
MRFVVLSYYHARYGPSVLLSIPDGLSSDIKEDLHRTLDLLEVPGFFVQQKSSYRTVNWHFEVPNERARGGKDMLLISIVLIEDEIEPESLKTCMKDFVDELKILDDLCWALNLEKLDEGSEQEVIRVQNAQNKLKTMLTDFKASLPDQFPPSIRGIEVGDLERIVEIDYQIHKKRRPDFWKRKIEHLRKRSFIPPLVAELGNKIIGFIFGEASSWEYIVPENIGWVDTLGVDPAYQGKGVARMLMEELLNFMEKIGVNTVYTLINWRDGDLLNFLNHMGFNRGDMINLELKLENSIIKAHSLEFNRLNYNNGDVKEFNDLLFENSPLITRMMRKEDLERIIEIDYKLLGERRPDFWESKIEMLEIKSDLSSLVAEVNGNVIGFILGEASGWEYVVPENIGWVDTMGVDAAYQRKGIARLLMNEMLIHMKQHGVNTVNTLVNWRDWPLLQFFESIGFKRGDMINLELKIGNK